MLRDLHANCDKPRSIFIQHSYERLRMRDKKMCVCGSVLVRCLRKSLLSAADKDAYADNQSCRTNSPQSTTISHQSALHRPNAVLAGVKGHVRMEL